MHGEARGTENGALTESTRYSGDGGWGYGGSWEEKGEGKTTLSGPHQTRNVPQRRSWDISFDPGEERGSRSKRAEAQGEHPDNCEGERRSEQDLRHVSSLWRQPPKST